MLFACSRKAKEVAVVLRLKQFRPHEAMKALAKEAKPQSAYAVLEGQFRQFAATLGFSVEAAAQRRGWASSCSGSIISQTYERKRSPHMVNIPRALFTGRTGLEPRYHVAIEELQDWAYTGNRLVPVKVYPSIVWERPKSRRRPRDVDDLEFLDRRVPSAGARTVR